MFQNSGENAFVAWTGCSTLSFFVLSVEAPCLNADFCLCILNQSSLNCIISGEFRNKLGFLKFFSPGENPFTISETPFLGVVGAQLEGLMRDRFNH